MAAPFVSGAAALLLAQDNSLSSSDVQNILQQTAVDLGPTGRDNQFGYGMLDIKAGLEFLVTKPTATIIPTSAQSSPTPDESGDSCFKKAQLGDYNCDGSINQADFTKWLDDAKTEIDLRFFEWIRRAFFNG